jgi:hypothetical protein
MEHIKYSFASNVFTCHFGHACHRFTTPVRNSITKVVANLRQSELRLLHGFYFRSYILCRRGKRMVSSHLKYRHMRRQKCATRSAESFLKSSWRSQFDCYWWSAMWCTRDDSSLLATNSPYLLPRVFRIHVILSLKGLYVPCGSIQSNASARNSCDQPGTGNPGRLDHVLRLSGLKLTITPPLNLCMENRR